MLALALLNYTRPFKEEAYFHMTNGSYFATIIVFIAVAVISIPQERFDQDFEYSVGTFLISVHIVLFGVMLYSIYAGAKNFFEIPGKQET